MGALLTVLIVFLIIFLLLMIKISFIIGYDTKPTVILKVLFFKLNFTEPKKKKKKESKAKKPKKQKKEKKDEKKKDEGIVSSPADVILLVKEVALGLLKKFFCHLRVDSLRLNVIVASDDPSKTALLYGTICPTAFIITDQLYRHKGKKSGEFESVIVPDFCASSPQFDIHIILSIKIWQILSCLMTGGLGFVRYYANKNNKKEGTENGRNANEENDRDLS